MNRRLVPPRLAQPLLVGIVLLALLEVSTAPAQENRGTIDELKTKAKQIEPYREPAPLVRAVQTVLNAITAAGQKKPAREQDDGLTAAYVRAAASAAINLPREHRGKAFLVALAVGLDDSNLLREHKLTRDLWCDIESDAERTQRLVAMSPPRMRGRRDLAQHFVVSAGLAAVFGPEVAESAGVFKELRDASGGSGFSFPDYCADMAGIALARAVQADPGCLQRVARSFAVADYLPDVSGLPEGISAADLARDFGSLLDPRFRRMRAELVRKVAQLPAYKTGNK